MYKKINILIKDERQKNEEKYPLYIVYFRKIKAQFF